nr:hypothetical protein [Tanacetum cinerariifolium]
MLQVRLFSKKVGGGYIADWRLCWLGLPVRKPNLKRVEKMSRNYVRFCKCMIFDVNMRCDKDLWHFMWIVQPEPIPALLGFTPAVLDIPNNNNGWIEEEPEEDPEMEEEEEEEEEEIDIEEEMDNPEIVNLYEIEEGKLPPLPADSNTSSDSEPEVEAEDENENEAATVGTITRAPYRVQPFSSTTYVGSRSSSKVFAPGPIGKDVDILHRKSVSMLEDQMRGLMLEDKEEKERLKKKLRVSQQEKEQMEQAFRHGQGINANETGGQDRAPLVCECTFSSFMKCNPTPFHGKEGAIELCRWFEKSEMVFSISDCAKRDKRKMEEFCPGEEVQRMEDELRSLKLRETNIAAYTQRFNELVLLCPEAVLTKKNMVEAYIKGLPENIKGRSGHCARYYRKKAVATGSNTQSILVCYGCGEKGHDETIVQTRITRKMKRLVDGLM